MTINRQGGGHENYREQDHEFFQTKKYFTRIYSGKASLLDNSPDVNQYLLDERGAQVLYVPTGTACGVRLTYTMVRQSSTDVLTVVSETEVGTILRVDAGTLTYTGGAIGSGGGGGAGTVTVTPTANSTVGGIEFVMSSTADEAAAGNPFRVTLMVECINIPYFPEVPYDNKELSSTTAATVEPGTI